jgi:hypothetical protein
MMLRIFRFFRPVRNIQDFVRFLKPDRSDGVENIQDLDLSGF